MLELEAATAADKGFTVDVAVDFVSNDLSEYWDRRHFHFLGTKAYTLAFKLDYAAVKNNSEIFGKGSKIVIVGVSSVDLQYTSSDFISSEVTGEYHPSLFSYIKCALPFWQWWDPCMALGKT
jgi:hypothetical protein